MSDIALVFWAATRHLTPEYDANALFGGYGGAHLGKRLPPQVVRSVALMIAGTMTVLFFMRAYR